MPGYAYGLPAKDCIVGSTLAKIPGSVCHGCYALKGNYRFPSVKNVQQRRLDSLGHPQWSEAMIAIIHGLKIKWFRWHDSGDLQGPAHLARIAKIAEACPKTRFWLPTREKVFVYSHRRQVGEFPKNLVVRVSGTMIDGPAPVGFSNTSTVTTGTPTCPAPKQNNECGDCRRCWNPRVANVSYRKH